MIARNFRRFPEALMHQLELALVQGARSAQGIAASVARAFAMLPAGCAPSGVPFLREPVRVKVLRAWPARALPAMWWWATAPLF